MDNFDSIRRLTNWAMMVIFTTPMLLVSIITLTNKNLTSKMLFKFPPLLIITEKSLHTGIVDAWYSSHPHYIQLELLQIILHFSFLTWLMRWGDHCCVTRITTVDEKLCIPSQKVLHHLYYRHFYTQSVIY